MIVRLIFGFLLFSAVVAGYACDNPNDCAQQCALINPTYLADCPSDSNCTCIISYSDPVSSSLSTCKNDAN